MHGVDVCHRVKQIIFTIPVNLQISNVGPIQFSLYALHCLTYKRFLVSWCKRCTFKLVLMCAILVINLSISVVSNVQYLWSNTTAQWGHHIHIIIINRNDYTWNGTRLLGPSGVNIHQMNCAIVHYKKCQPRKVGGTKHRASPPLQKVGGTCPHVHPRIYAHAAV